MDPNFIVFKIERGEICAHFEQKSIHIATEEEITRTETILADMLHSFTYDTLNRLVAESVAPKHQLPAITINEVGLLKDATERFIQTLTDTAERLGLNRLGDAYLELANLRYLQQTLVTVEVGYYEEEEERNYFK